MEDKFAKVTTQIFNIIKGEKISIDDVKTVSKGYVLRQDSQEYAKALEDKVKAGEEFDS